MFYRRLVKPAGDRLLAAALMPAALPVGFLLAALVRLRLGRPVLFRQRRIGLQEQSFEFLKFRTMTDERDADGKLLPDEVRLTPFGRFLRATSLDELPQLWNVIKGDMSLIGPRPLLPEYLPRYSEFQRRRHEVKPGITGLAQILGRNTLSWERKFELDVQYVDACSFLMDARIILLTLISVIRREGISQTGHATAAPFLGSASAKHPEQHP